MLRKFDTGVDFSKFTSNPPKASKLPRVPSPDPKTLVSLDTLDALGADIHKKAAFETEPSKQVEKPPYPTYPTEAEKREECEERAAIIQHEGMAPDEWKGQIPEAWAEGCAVLCIMPRPAAFTPERWQQILNDAGYFIDEWAAQVAAFGWSAFEVFGVHPVAPEVRLDARGLVVGLKGRKILAVTESGATVASSRDEPLRLNRLLTAHEDSVRPLWTISGARAAT